MRESIKTACVSKYISRVESCAHAFSCVTAFSTIAWDDLEDCASVVRRESDSLGSQVSTRKKCLIFTLMFHVTPDFFHVNPRISNHSCLPERYNVVTGLRHSQAVNV